VTARTQAEVDEFRRKREVHVVGTGVPRPVTNFEEASFPCEGLRVKAVLDRTACQHTPSGLMPCPCCRHLSGFSSHPHAA